MFEAKMTSNLSDFIKSYFSDGLDKQGVTIKYIYIYIKEKEEDEEAR